MLKKIMVMEATMANMWIRFQSITRPSKGRRFFESAFEASRMAFWQTLRLKNLLKFYLLVVNELCNRSSKEVDEQCWKDNGNCVHNVGHRENLRISKTNLFERNIFIWLKIPSRLWASALSEGRWRWRGTCRMQGQIDSVEENLSCNDKRWPKRKSNGYRGEKPIPYDRVVNKSVHHQVGIPGTDCSHRLYHWSPQLPSIEEIWFLCFFLLNVSFSYWVHVLPMFIMKSAASATIKPIPAKHNFVSGGWIW